MCHPLFIQSKSELAQVTKPQLYLYGDFMITPSMYANSFTSLESVFFLPVIKEY